MRNTYKIIAYLIRVIACCFRNDMFQNKCLGRFYQFFNYTIYLFLAHYIGYKFGFLYLIVYVICLAFFFLGLNKFIEKSQNSNV